MINSLCCFHTVGEKPAEGPPKAPELVQARAGIRTQVFLFGSPGPALTWLVLLCCADPVFLKCQSLAISVKGNRAKGTASPRSFGHL